MKKVIIGMSGGVDSSVAAAVLLKQGYNVIGATLSLYRENDLQKADISDAAAVCQALGIEYRVYDFIKEFKEEVINNFINSYINGLTPNPCIVCNKKIKFSALLNKADAEGFDYIATGHYSNIKYDSGSGRYLLMRPADQNKDQTYMLYSLTQEQLSRTLMPLSGLTKDDVRTIANDLKLSVAERKDSQDICFVPDGNYAAFIERVSGYKPSAGDYINTDGKVMGRHKGVINYTVGQRKGLGVAFGKPQFVVSKNSALNTVTLGDEELLFKTAVTVKNTNFIPFETLNAPLNVQAKLRYRHNAQPATIYPVNENTVKIIFDEPQRAPAPGQAAVFYDGDVVVGGGEIANDE